MKSSSDIKRASCARASALFVIQSRHTGTSANILTKAVQQSVSSDGHDAANVDRKHVLNIWSLRQACPDVSIHAISDEMATTDVLQNDVNVNFNARYLKQVKASDSSRETLF